MQKKKLPSCHAAKLVQPRCKSLFLTKELQFLENSQVFQTRLSTIYTYSSSSKIYYKSGIGIRFVISQLCATLKCSMKIFLFVLTIMILHNSVSGEKYISVKNNWTMEASHLSNPVRNPSTDFNTVFFFSNESMSNSDRRASWLVVLLVMDTLRCVFRLRQQSGPL
jgi:hypothetical protein